MLEQATKEHIKCIRMIRCPCGGDRVGKYNPERNETTHAAADAGACEEMSTKYDWPLVGVKQTEREVLPVDCVFEGDRSFPPGGVALSHPETYTKEEEQQ